MIEICHKGSVYQYSKDDGGKRGSWLLVKGRGLGSLNGTPYCSVPIGYWKELRVAAIDAGYSSTDFAPIVEKMQKKTSEKKSNGQSISIF